MFISPAFAQADGGGSVITSLMPLMLLILIAGLIYYFSKKGRQETSRKGRQETSRSWADSQIIIKTYKGKQAEAMSRFQADSIGMADEGFFPTSQSWAPGQWGTEAFVVALLLCFFLIGFVALIYMLIVKPDGALTVTYERRTGSFEEKTCPTCAERIKAAALVCHFCGHKFAPEELAAQHDAVLAEQRLAAQLHAAAKAEFPDELNDYLYRVEKDGSVSAVNRRGEHIRFHDWQSFWKAANE
jgi:hypothetical protein